MIKKETDQHINKLLGSPNLYEIKKICTLLNCSSPSKSSANVAE